MASRGYGQFCGVARALELVGERWALLIVRDLLVGPRRFSDLRRGLPRIPTNVLAGRLKELEHSGIVQRRVLPRPAASVVYELTAYGSQLEDALMRLGVWGAQSLGTPRPGEIMTTDSMVMALRSTFVPEAAHGVQVSFELHLGEITLHARINGPTIAVAEGALADADLIIEAGPAVKDLMTGELSPAVAIASGSVRLTGNAALLDRFAELFHIATRPAPQRADSAKWQTDLAMRVADGSA
jgi:DNA-binding HxlR family transcriptional regulator/putative sterol carrier protein